MLFHSKIYIWSHVFPKIFLYRHDSVWRVFSAAHLLSNDRKYYRNTIESSASLWSSGFSIYIDVTLIIKVTLNVGYNSIKLNIYSIKFAEYYRSKIILIEGLNRTSRKKVQIHLLLQDYWQLCGFIIMLHSQATDISDPCLRPHPILNKL